MRALLISLVLFVAIPCVARAEPVPDYVALPPHYTLGATQYERYGQFDVSVPDPASPRHATHVVSPAGHRWQVQVVGDARGLTNALWHPVLEHAGWRVLVDSGLLVAQHDAPHGVTWLKFSGAGRFELIEEAPVAPLVLPRPADAAPESASAGQDLPYLLPLPGMTQSGFRVEASTPEEMTGPITDGPFYVGPPVTHIDYRGPTEISSLEVQTAYAAALAAAGWTMNYSHLAGMTVAHYAQRGRDVWVKLYGTPGALHVAVADLGANAAAARLRATLDAQGHVALYGIYFDSDRDTLRPDSDATLRQILALLHDVPTLRLEIQGHTDDTGAAEHNQALSQARAASVVRWLTAHGVAAARLTPVGYGATRPVADNHSTQGRALNRRVELARVAR